MPPFTYDEDVTRPPTGGERVAAVRADASAVVEQATGLQELFDGITAVLTRAGFALVWVGQRDEYSRRLRIAGVAGSGADYLAFVQASAGDLMEGQGPTSSAMRSASPSVSNDIARDPRMAPWKGAAETIGFASSASLPLQVGGRTLGSLNLYATTKGAFDEATVEALADVAALVSAAWTRLAST